MAFQFLFTEAVTQPTELLVQKSHFYTIAKAGLEFNNIAQVVLKP